MSSTPKKASDVVNNFGIVLVGLVSTVLLWASVVALQAYYSSSAGDVETERLATNQGKEVRELKAQQLAALHDWTWVDQKAQTVTLSIDRAMELVVRDAAAGTPSLVPAIGAHDQPTVPAQPGHPADGAAAPAGGAAAPATPAGATGAATPAPADGAAATPAPAGTAVSGEGGNSDAPASAPPR